MHLRASLTLAVVALAAAPAHAGERSLATGAFELAIDGADGGAVHSLGRSDRADKTLTISTEQPSGPVLAAVRALLEGNVQKRALALSTPAVVQKVSDARLVEVRMPSYAGGATDVALTFEVGATSTSPSLRAVSDRAKPATRKLAGFRLALGDLPTSEVTQLGAVALKKHGAAAVPAPITFDVPSRDASPYLAWAKKAAAREGRIEYVSTMGEVVLALKVTGCAATSAQIDGPVTHVTVHCTRATGG